MKKLTKQAFDKIWLFVYRNARNLELSIWQYEFENGSSDAIVSALQKYQNPDGGFGNTLEPDCWNPNSSPYTTLYAAEILQKINFADTNHPIMCGIINYFKSGAESRDYGWQFNIASNNDWPHAPWWTYSPESNVNESIGVTIGICGFILRHAKNETELYKKALSLIDTAIARLNDPGNFGEMGIGAFCSLLETIKQTGLESNYDMDYLSATIKKLVNDVIERDSSKWVHYTRRPSDLINTPESRFYEGNEEVIQTELDYLIDTRIPNGVWPITWSWHENLEKYSKEFAISENWWMAHNAIYKVKFLKAFGRVE